MDLKHVELLAFRQAHFQHTLDNLRSRVENELLEAYSGGYRDGQREMKDDLIKRLKEYEKDSVVAKLLAELLQKELAEE